MDFKPTAEQEAALELFRTGENLVIQARAGAAKTTTVQLIAEANPHRTGVFTAFNKLIVTDAGTRMPSSIVASTMHSLAFRAVGKRFAHRLRSARMKSQEVARRLRIDPLVVRYGTESKPLAAGFLAGQTMRALKVFCQSADAEPTEAHFPYLDGIDQPYPDGRRSWENNRAVRAHLMPALRRAWGDWTDPDGQLSYDHSAYLKLWERQNPTILCDFLAVDEANDLSGVMLSVVSQQKDCQVVIVGDSQQQINRWMGSADALASFDAPNRTWLTASFRFGPAVADVANGLLERIGAHANVVGAAPWASVVAPVPEPSAVLCRTNAEAVRTVMGEQEASRSVHLTGGAEEVASFARAAKDLMAGRWVSHHDLACFSDWSQVRSYVSDDPQGSELRLLVKLIEDFGADAVISAVSGSVRLADAEVVVSTAHRSKGMGFDSVKLAGDFMPPRDGSADVSEDELMLLYVATTRAKRELDVTAVPHALAPPGKQETSAPALPLPLPEQSESAFDLTLRYGTRQATEPGGAAS